MITKEQNQKYIGKLKTLLGYLISGKITKDQHHQLTRELYEVYILGRPLPEAKKAILESNKPVGVEDIKREL